MMPRLGWWWKCWRKVRNFSLMKKNISNWMKDCIWIILKYFRLRSECVWKERRFLYGIEKELLDETECHRAKAKVCFRDDRAELPDVNCRKTDDFCRSCEFSEKHREKFSRLKDEKNLPKQIRTAITKLSENQEPMKGNICKTVGDCIIALEALETTENSLHYQS